MHLYLFTVLSQDLVNKAIHFHAQRSVPVLSKILGDHIILFSFNQGNILSKSLLNQHDIVYPLRKLSQDLVHKALHLQVKRFPPLLSKILFTYYVLLI